MKRLPLFFLFILLLPREGCCDCLDYCGFFPQQYQVAPTQVFLIQKSVFSDHDGLDTKFGWRMCSVSDTVPLLVMHRFKGYQQAQVLLSPQRPLLVGERYSIEPLDTAEGMPSSGDQSWLIVEQDSLFAGSVQPGWREAPQGAKAVSCKAGCGPVRWQNFYAPASSAVFLILAELRDVDADTVLRGFVFDWDDDTLRIGHDMCSGPLAVREGHAYEMRFTLLGYDGVQYADPKKYEVFIPHFDNVQRFPFHLIWIALGGFAVLLVSLFILWRRKKSPA